MEYVLKTNGLTKSYKNFQALNGLSMHIPKGSIYGFIGKNGAGKTTLIRLICGLQQPDEGEYTLYENLNHDPSIIESRRRMGAIIETPSIYLDLSAKENLIQQAKILGHPSLDGLEEILRLVGLNDTGKKKAKHFSLGMRQRLGIAIALVGRPDFIVLDEPINGLDPQGIVEIRELILKLNKEQQITVLISSHFLDELSKLATHYGFIERGRIIKEISATELEFSCRSYIRNEVTNIHTLSRLLDSKHLEYSILSKTTADIYSKINISELILMLKKENCEVLSLQEKEESLESYYISLLGGKDHA